MSIKLCVEDYCHSCPNFEAEVEKTVVNEYGDPVIVLTDIYCQHRNICKNISNHLKTYKGGDKSADSRV